MSKDGLRDKRAQARFLIVHVLVEASTYPTRRPPSYMARLLGAVRFHNQSKFVGDANRALNFERRPGIG